MPGSNFLLLSGEHPTLPYSEVRAILNSEGIGFVENERGDQVLILTPDDGIEELLTSRAALVMEGGALLGRAGLSMGSVVRTCSEIDWGFLGGRTFGVRATRVKRYWDGVDLRALEKTIGDSVPRSLGARVNLSRPEVWVRAVISGENVYIFSRSFRTDRGAFVRRRPKSRPYFHPGVLEPKIARVFVNLSAVKPRDLFLDPFCGTGGFLIEAAMMGMNAVGIDLDLRMVRGAMKNTRFYGLDCGVVHGDGASGIVKRADGIATDPPYGRGTSTGGERVEDLIRGLARMAHDVLKSQGRICFASPSEISPSRIAEEEGLSVLEEHMMRVHKSLTRAIVIAGRG
ncbi:MAG: THUMP domain-containing protein [Candidatus Methanomethylicaceae archaeon]